MVRIHLVSTWHLLKSNGKFSLENAKTARDSSGFLVASILLATLGVFELNLYFSPNLRDHQIQIYLELQQLFGFSITLKRAIFASELNIYLLISAFFVKRFEPPLTGIGIML